MKQAVAGIISRLQHLFLGPAGRFTEPPPSLEDELERARAEWVSARSVFDEVSEPPLVDQAIYQLLVAEQRYSLLLRDARRAIGGLSS